MILQPVTRRLFATLRCDMRLQMRNGFYYVTLFVLGFWALLVTQMPALNLNWLMPMIVLGNMVINTFYFIAALVLLEKGEGSLQSQVVTPLRPWEYLACKVLSLSALTLAENLILVLLFAGFSFHPLPLLLGMLCGAALFSLAGFIVVARYESINEFLMPSVGYTILLMLPLLAYMGNWQHWILYLHPLQAPLVLLQSAFQPLSRWEVLYGIVYSLGWILIAGKISLDAFARYLITREGVI